jgi:glyoxylase-like metal-dependent hydrolase (beta-lactamase superfamily II)
MAAPPKKKELARGERVLPGVWRLRLPLPWPGVPHCNAWAVRSGDGIVLFDTGYAGPEGTRPLEYALAQVGLELADVRLVACTHVHADHYGLAGPIADAAGCEVWLHPAWETAREYAENPDAVLEQRLEVARQSGVPPAALERYREERKGEPSGIARAVPPDRELVDGVEVETDLGAFVVHETPGHAPSHVVFHEPESGLLISGDHLLGRIVLYFDYGLSPDPVAEFSHSLEVVEGLECGLCLSGHGRPFRGVREKVRATREVLEGQLQRVREAVGSEPRSAFELLGDILGAENLTPQTAPWALQITLVYLDHLTRLGELEESERDGKRLWRRARA